MPPGPRRMLTPETASEIAKSACVTCRAQPPFWIRLGALLNDPQNSGMSPTSVAGGLWNEGNWLSSAGFFGPGSDRPAGLALIAPCAGESGLPNEAAWAAVAKTAAPPAAPSARISRREKGTTDLSLLAELDRHGSNAAFSVSVGAPDN